MALGTVEILALILVVLVVIKLLFLIFSPKSWLSFVKGLYKSPRTLIFVELVLIIIVFYYLLQSFTIIQIMAVVLLGALLTGLGFAVYSKEIISMVNNLFKKKDIVKRAWLPLIVWVVLIVWTLLAIFS